MMDPDQAFFGEGWMWPTGQLPHHYPKGSGASTCQRQFRPDVSEVALKQGWKHPVKDVPPGKVCKVCLGQVGGR